MIGYSYYSNGQNVIEQHEEKFAWWPVRSSFSKKRIWLQKYDIIHILYDQTGRPPIKGRSWQLIYTKNEYLVMLLKRESE